MIRFSDRQLEIVMNAAAGIDQERRALFLQRLAAMIDMRGHNFTDSDLAEIVGLAKTGLVREPA